MERKMKVEIWSDIMCPFCYIGKRNYETALKQFAGSDNLQLEWHSFQLAPTIPVKLAPKQNVYQYLASRKGMSYEQSVNMHEAVVATAKQAGLTYNFEKAVIANSLDAHRVIQMAKTKGLGDAAEERLFYAYFTEGKDMSDRATLISLGKDIGLSEAEVLEALNDDQYVLSVRQDVQEAEQIGIRGVPFFVFDRKYAVSGAQPPEAFLQTLNKSFSEWQQVHSDAALEVTEGTSCGAEGDC